MRQMERSAGAPISSSVAAARGCGASPRVDIRRHKLSRPDERTQFRCALSIRANA